MEELGFPVVLYKVCMGSTDKQSYPSYGSCATCFVRFEVVSQLCGVLYKGHLSIESNFLPEGESQAFGLHYRSRP